MKRHLLTACFLLTGLYLSAQDFSNKGKDFWLCYPGHIDGDKSRMALYISSDVNTTGTVYVGGSSIPFTVEANKAKVVQIFPTSYPVMNPQSEGVGKKRGIQVVSNDPVVLYAHILNAARSGSSLILPTNTLGREYIASSYKSSGNSGTPGDAQNASPPGSQFTVVAVEDSTVIEVIPKVADYDGTRPANVPFEVKLNKGDVYQFRSRFNFDVTGSSIKSMASGTGGCKPIAVFSGSSWTTLECNGASGGDNLFQQLMPKSAWGKNYITAPFADRPYDIFRVIVSDPTTKVYRNGTELLPITLINGTYYEFKGSIANEIKSDKPIMVVQYMVSQTCDTRNGGSTSNAPFPGDPEMIILNPVEQTINEVTVVSARNDLTPPNTNITKHFFTIIMKTNAIGTLMIDGKAPTGTFIPIGTSGFSYLHENVTASTGINPSHTIKADSGFIALAYGLGNVESYGYNAGTNVRDLYQFISIQNTLATVNFPATCKAAPFYLSMTFPYQPSQIKWQFGGILPDTTIDAPVYDSTYFVGDRQIYRYKLPGTYAVHAVGTFPIKVFALNPTPDGCTGLQEINFELKVFDKPVAGFNFLSSGCISDSVKFNDISNGLGRSIIKWQYDFDDGNTSDLKNPVHLYKIPGDFTARMTIMTDIGCVSDTFTNRIEINPAPLTNFNFTKPVCETQPVTFTGDATVVYGTIKTWEWSMGDGTPVMTRSSNIPFNYTYNVPGDYIVNLRTTTEKGCFSDTSYNVKVNAKPMVGLILPENCLLDPYSQFIDTTRISDGSDAFLNYQWTFGDTNATPSNPNTSNEKNPKHKYTITGDYNVKLKVTSKDGCADSTSQVFTINGSVPQSGFDFVQPVYCSNKDVVIKNTSTVDVGKIVKLEIYWDDANDPSLMTTDDLPYNGKTYNFKYPEFTSPASKTYRIKVVAYSGELCFQTSIRDLTILAIPDVRFDALNPVCANDPSFTINTASVSNMTGRYAFSGPGVSAGGVFNPSIATAGMHTINYTFTADNTCVVTLPQDIEVYPVPVVSAGPDKTILAGGSEVLGGSASGNNITYLWTPSLYLNDATIATPITTPADDISYTLTVSSEDGCKLSDQVFVKLLKMPLVPNAFSPNNDGIHDKWIINHLESYDGATVEIFNRYGQLVFKSTGYTKAWDGTQNGKPLPVGTYYYIINPKHGRKQIAGFVDIIR